MSKKVDYLVTTENVRAVMADVWQMVNKGLGRGDVLVTLGRKRRSLDQNAKLHPMIRDISRQVEWFGMMHNEDQWKEIITGSFENCDFVPGINGGLVMIGARTSRYSKQRFSELIEYIYAFGAEKNVVWSEPALKVYQEYLKR